MESPESQDELQQDSDEYLWLPLTWTGPSDEDWFRGGTPGSAMTAAALLKASGAAEVQTNTWAGWWVEAMEAGA